MQLSYTSSSSLVVLMLFCLTMSDVGSSWCNCPILATWGRIVLMQLSNISCLMSDCPDAIVPYSRLRSGRLRVFLPDGIHHMRCYVYSLWCRIAFHLHVFYFHFTGFTWVMGRLHNNVPAHLLPGDRKFEGGGCYSHRVTTMHAEWFCLKIDGPWCKPFCCFIHFD